MAHPIIEALAAETNPDIIIPDVLHTSEYTGLKYRFNSAISLAAQKSNVFSGGFYMMTHRGSPQSALEVRTWIKVTNNLLSRWETPALQQQIKDAQRAQRVWQKDDTVLATADSLKASLVAAAAFLTRWSPLAEKMIAAKARVLKGRKPSTTPRTTEPRTIENTGTCACCDRNIKLDGRKKIVEHGFTIRPGYRLGRCFGVGYSPIELGKDGLEAFLVSLSQWRAGSEKLIETLKARDPNEELQRSNVQPYRTVREKLEAAEYDLKSTLSDMRRIAQRIATWKPSPLPKS